MAVSFLGWRAIFWISIAVAAIALYLIRDTPDSKVAETGTHHRFDWSGLLAFVAAMLVINIFITQGPKLGWFSGASLGLIVAFVLFILAFFRIETRKPGPFVDLSIFDSKTFAGAILSNSLLNGLAGTLVVALGLVQQASSLGSASLNEARRTMPPLRRRRRSVPVRRCRSRRQTPPSARWPAPA